MKEDYDTVEIERRCVLDGKHIEADEHGRAMVRTMCGREVSSKWDDKWKCWRENEWIFRDPTHAVLTGIEGSSIYVCEKCADVGIKALERLK